MKYVKIQSYPIGQANVTIIEAKACFKIKVRNDSPGTILVDGLAIESGKSETFDGLPADAVFAQDFGINLDDAGTPMVYVTRYFYTENMC